MMEPRFLSWLGFLTFTFLVGLAVLCHVQTMTTNPGTLPKGYKELDEGKLTLKFTKLFDERNSLHISPQIRKLMRQGNLSQAEALKMECERNSVYKKAKRELVEDGSSKVEGIEGGLEINASGREELLRRKVVNEESCAEAGKLLMPDNACRPESA